MNVARLLYPVNVLGPGNRIGIWFAGCPRRCPGCSNPELWEKKDKYEISVERLIDLINRVRASHTVDGFTLTGGDPFFQPEELTGLLEILSEYTKDILIYTGYTKEELESNESAAVADCLSMTGVLVDGPYIESRNNGAVLRGSDNQRIWILKPELEPKYQEYISHNKNRIQNFNTGDGVVSVGIHRPGFACSLAEAARGKGVIIHE